MEMSIFSKYRHSSIGDFITSINLDFMSKATDQTRNLEIFQRPSQTFVDPYNYV